MTLQWLPMLLIFINIMGWLSLLAQFIYRKIRIRKRMIGFERISEECDRKMDIFMKECQEIDEKYKDKMGIPYRPHVFHWSSDCRDLKICKLWKQDD